MVKNNPSALKWIFKNARKFLPALAALTVVGALLSSFGVALALLSRDVIDVATGGLSGSLAQKGLVLALLIVLQLLMQVIYSLISINVSGRLKMLLRNRLFSLLLGKDWMSVSTYHSGDLLNRIDSDVSVVSAGITGILPDVVSLVTKVVLSFAALFALDVGMALVFAVLGPLIMLVSRLYGKKMKSFHKLCQESEGKVRSFIQEGLANLLVIKSFGSEGTIIGHSKKLQRESFRLNLRRNNISISANILFYITLTASYYFALGWGAFKISSGAMSFGALTAVLQLIGQIQMPFKNLSSVLPQYYGMVASAERMIELEQLDDEAAHNAGELDREKTYNQMSGIVLSGVTFSYDGEDKVLDNISITIKKGEFTTVAGKSGIGKSTFLRLLLGILRPAEGSVYLEMSDGSRLMADKMTRRLFAYVPQGNMILSGTIRENIAFSEGAPDDALLISCAKTAEIWEFVSSLPDKLDTALGEKGLGLSEGQIQRIAIARALYSKAPIILLDEATSALDAATEKKVLENIKSLAGKTCIIVSHRSAAGEISDNNIYLNKKVSS